MLNITFIGCKYVSRHITHAVKLMNRKITLIPEISHYDASLLPQPQLILVYCCENEPENIIFLRKIKEHHPKTPIIVILEKFNEALCLLALRSRIWDCITLPKEASYLKRCIHYLEEKTDEIDKSNKETNFPLFFPDEYITRNQSNRTTNKALLYITGNYMEKIRIKDLANESNLSVDFFSRKFKLEHGCTPREYIKRYRIGIAKNMLQSTELSVENIASLSGFESCSLFSRLFKELTGNSPSSFRRHSGLTV